MPASHEEIVVALLKHQRTAQPGSAGIRVERPSRKDRFQLLAHATLSFQMRDLTKATSAVRELRGRGLDSAEAVASAPLRALTAAFRAAGYGALAPVAAERLRDLARSIKREYEGDLEHLREQAQRSPARERRLLRKLSGVGEGTVDLFFQHAQASWSELYPYLAPSALKAAGRLGLPVSPKSLDGIGIVVSMPTLGASLAQTYRARDYLDVLRKASSGPSASGKRTRSGKEGRTPSTPAERAILRRLVKAKSATTRPKPKASKRMEPRTSRGLSRAPHGGDGGDLRATPPPRRRGQRAKPPERVAANGDGGEAAAPPSTLAAANGGAGPSSPPGGGDGRPPPPGYALLRTPRAGVVGEPFPVTFGLSKSKTDEGAGGAVQPPDWITGDYQLKVKLFAVGFEVLNDAPLIHLLDVTSARPYPTATIRIRPAPQVGALFTRRISADFVIDGQLVGSIERDLTIGRTHGDLEAARPGRGPSTTTTVPPIGRVDLTVTILQPEPSFPGKLLFSYENGHGLENPGDEPLDIGGDAKSFAMKLVREIDSVEGRDGLRETLSGKAKDITDLLPKSFWQIFRAVAAKVSGPPVVMLRSAEPYVPWELAEVPEPLPIPGAPPFLCTQAVTGRWLSGGPPPLAADAKPVKVSAMAVVFGKYEGKNRLRQAEKEASCLEARYSAAPVPAYRKDVLKAMKGNPPAQILHFSVHGQVDPMGLSGLVLPRPPKRSVRGGGGAAELDVLTDDMVRGAGLPGRPFVFLNACQVGMADQVLGDYAGLAAAFIKAGAAGVVAPLWSIDDRKARDIALRFYEAALATEGGKSVAQVFREQRVKYGSRGLSSTYLAYQFYGHPAMPLAASLTRKEAPDGCLGKA